MKKFNEIIKILKSNEGLKLEGVFVNTLTSMLNRVHPVGGFSVHIVDDEIRIFQHPGAGDEEYIIKMGQATTPAI